MDSKLRYAVFDTQGGWLGVLGSSYGLKCLTLPQRSAEEAQLLLGDGVNYAIFSHDFFEDLIERLKNYFAGKKTLFSDKLDLAGATAFQRQVLGVTRLIPYGEARSYGWVASKIGKPQAVRAVGQALGSNPLPIIIPCHRVVASDGKLGGFGGGLEMKRYLLALEGLSYN